MHSRVSRAVFGLVLTAWLLVTSLDISGGVRLHAEDATTVSRSVAALRNIGREGAGFEQARLAVEELRRVHVSQIAVLLDGMSDVTPVAENWFRGVVFDVVRRANSISVDALSEYAMDRSRNPIGRGLAMELIDAQVPARAEKLIAKCLDDPSLRLREMAVQQTIEKAADQKKDDPDSARAEYRNALVAARHPQQLSKIVRELRELGDEEVNLADAFAMITQWKSLAPFNNVGGVGYDTEYPPEQEFASSGSLDLSAKFEGKNGSIQWRTLTASGDEGEVDVADAYEKEKGAVGYLFAEFDSSVKRKATARLSSSNANKIWINGQLVTENEVYHSGSMIDQYTADFELRAGTNRILLKICQNEQTDSWAQDWGFQFRITDAMGKALRSGD